MTSAYEAIAISITANRSPMPAEVISALNRTPPPELVETLPTWGDSSAPAPSYLSTASAIVLANQVFGQGNWGRLYHPAEPWYNAAGQMFGYHCGATVWAYNTFFSDDGGHFLRSRDGTIQDTPDSHDAALKGAQSDALKRALRHFGPLFGLDLYQKPTVAAAIANTAAKRLLPLIEGDDDAVKFDQAKRIVWGGYGTPEHSSVTRSVMLIEQARNRSAAESKPKPPTPPAPEPTPPEPTPPEPTPPERTARAAVSPGSNSPDDLPEPFDE